MKPVTIILALVLGFSLGQTTRADACSRETITDDAFEDFLRDGYLRDRQGDYRGAVDVFQRAIVLRPTNRKVRFLLANTLWRDNQWMNARFAWESLLRQGGEDRMGIEARNWLRDNAREGWIPQVKTLAGGSAGFADGEGRLARFSRPSGMAVAADGSLLITDTGNHRIRLVKPDGKVITAAGSGVPGYSDGPALQARLEAPTGGALDPAGNYYFIDGTRIRFLTPDGRVGTLAGDGVAGFIDGGPQVARFARPVAVAADWRGHVVVIDNGTAIRMVSPQGNVTTVAGGLEPGLSDGEGSAAKLRYVTRMRMLDKDHVLLVDTGNNRMRELNIPSGMVKTHPGCGVGGYIDGPLEAAHWKELNGVIVDPLGNLIVADSGNRAIRRITLGQNVQTLAGGHRGGEAKDGSGMWARFGDPVELGMYGKTLFILDRGAHGIRTMDLGGLYL